MISDFTEAELEHQRKMYAEYEATLEGRVARDIDAAVEAEREVCAKVAEAAPLAPDTQVGTRQRDLKARIVAAIRARGKG